MSTPHLAALPDEPLWTAVDVARFLQVSRSWVYARCEAGLLPCLRVGGLVRFVPQQIREFASAGAAPAAPAAVFPPRPKGRG
jgi:predicted DNA-binding transcriptional regulator AlpA